ncbi:MAG: alkyl sulfatase dimerization domain-containing protein [bacterium]|nr:MBL fold metallo-hydrolase [Gammaproteobacteria bacterium]HIL95341.1 MBL fold metallo-hydrolase [Pseudomonadales bacterium]
MKSVLTKHLVLLICVLFSNPATYAASSGSAKEAEPLGTENEATPITAKVNEDLLKLLPFRDMEDFKNAQKGFIDRGEEEIVDANGKIVWSTKKFAFMQDLKTKSPATVNPSLWRQMLLVNMTGLYKVNEHIYQVRNYDLANFTIIEGKSGLIIMDPLVSAEPAKAALELYYKHRPRKPVVAVIFTHSHIDHFGGVRGIVEEADIQSGKVKVYAPLGFVENAIAENVMAGNAMSRRASYMYGNVLPKNEKGNIGAGLGSSTSSGNVTMVVPTNIISEAWEDHVIDGLHFEFQLTLNTEAPSEMHYYIKDYKALCPAENVNHTMHNLYTLRGAKVRDSKAWSKHIDNMLLRWGDEAQVLFAPHHWPSWGNDEINKHVAKQRDTYKFMHDQVLRLANHGYTIDEVGDMVELPQALDDTWASHGYYGSISHNARAIYNFYLGYFDGNPSHLHKLSPEPGSVKYVEYMGGSKNVIKMARKDYANGEYRWVAEALDHVVFAEPNNKVAKDLLADTLEQLGYVAESGPWRNFYLSGARELREGVKAAPTPNTASPDVVKNMPIVMIFDYMAVRLNPEKAAGKKLKINFVFTDTNELYTVFLENSTLNNREGNADDADSTITTTRASLDSIMLGQLSVKKGLQSGAIIVQGAKGRFQELQGMLDDFEFWFNIVTP